MGFRYVVRHAKPEDCSDILRLTRELAEFEGEQPDEVVHNTEEGLRDDCFGDQAFYHCLVAQAGEDGEGVDSGKATVVGHAMYFWAYSSWLGRLIYLEDLYVQPAHRGKGLGRALVCEVAKIGVEKGCKGMQWVVQNVNAAARQFYDRLDTTDKTAAEGWRLMGAREEKFVKLANLQPKPESNIEIHR